MLGRVLGVLNAFAMGAAPLGIVLAGYLLEGIGLRYTVAGVAACFAAVALGVLLNPAFRQMDAPSGSG